MPALVQHGLMLYVDVGLGSGVTIGPIGVSRGFSGCPETLPGHYFLNVP